MITLDDIRQAQTRIKGVIYRTPLIPWPDPHETTVWVKPETLQPIGSFKLRGAFNRIAAIVETEHIDGVIAFSSGNHAQGVAFSAARLGLPAVIVMPTNTPPVKLAATRSYGAEIVLYDAILEDRHVVSQRVMQDKIEAGQHWALIPPFNDPHVIAGQGTIGLEIFEDLPDVDLVMTPLGGGGLLSGVATAIKSCKPSVKVIGVEPELAADGQASLRSGKIVTLTAQEANRTIADGVRTLSIGELTFEHIQRYVDDIVTVSEAEINEAIRRVLFTLKLVVEPSGVLPVAAYLFHRDQLPDAKKVALVLSGGNIEPSFLAELLEA